MGAKGAAVRQASHPVNKASVEPSEKISTETIGAHSGGEEFEAQKEVPVYGGELGEGNLLGSVPVYSTSTVGEVKAFISERFTLTPGANLRKRGQRDSGKGRG